MSQTVAEQPLQDNDSESTDRTLVAESIRYRKRAQNAEHKVEDLSGQLNEAHQRIAQLSEDVEGLTLDRKLASKLTAAGATDLEAATLIARARMAGHAESDIDACVKQLQVDKEYLFAGVKPVVTSRPTAGVKDRIAPGKTMLERAATKAAKSGTRTDLQEYLKLRRGLV